VELRQLHTSGPQEQASAGMYVFGDFLLFGFLTCALLAPAGRSRRALLAATGIEGAVGALLFIYLFATRISQA
jgi:hypothetical protein